MLAWVLENSRLHDLRRPPLSPGVSPTSLSSMGHPSKPLMYCFQGFLGQHSHWPLVASCSDNILIRFSFQVAPNKAGPDLPSEGRWSQGQNLVLCSWSLFGSFIFFQPLGLYLVQALIKYLTLPLPNYWPNDHLPGKRSSGTRPWAPGKLDSFPLHCGGGKSGHWLNF